MKQHGIVEWIADVRRVVERKRKEDLQEDRKNIEKAKLLLKDDTVLLRKVKNKLSFGTKAGDFLATTESCFGMVLCSHDEKTFIRRMSGDGENRGIVCVVHPHKLSYVLTDKRETYKPLTIEQHARVRSFLIASRERLMREINKEVMLE